MEGCGRLIAVGVQRPAVDKPSSGSYYSPSEAILAVVQLPNHVREGHCEIWSRWLEKVRKDQYIIWGTRREGEEMMKASYLGAMGYSQRYNFHHLADTPNLPRP